jgi:hypothetical protein
LRDGQAQQTSRVVTFGCSRVPSVAGSSRGRTDKGVTTESQRNARDSGWAHWGQFGQRRSTVDAQQQRGSVWRDEGSGLWVVGVGVGMRVRVGVEQTDKMLRAIPTWRLLGRRGRQPRRSDASTRCGPKTLNASLSPRGASSASRLISRCTALHCMIESWRTAGRDTHIATIQSGRATVQHHTRRADGGLELRSTHGCHASGA